MWMEVEGKEAGSPVSVGMHVDVNGEEESVVTGSRERVGVETKSGYSVWSGCKRLLSMSGSQLDLSGDPPIKRDGFRRDFTSMVYNPQEAQLVHIPVGHYVQIFVPFSVIDMQVLHGGGLESLQVFGTDVYLHTSNYFGAAVHAGMINFEDFIELVYQADKPMEVVTNPISLERRKVKVSKVLGVSFCFQVLQPPEDGYVGSYRNGIASHNWHSFSARAFKFQSVYLFVKTSVNTRCMIPCGGTPTHQIRLTRKDIDRLSGVGDRTSVPLTNKDTRSAVVHRRPSLYLTEDCSVDAATGQARSFYIPNVTILFNLTNDPCVKYNLGAVSDRGYNIKLRTSYRLLSEVLYLEHKRTRYELCAEEKTPSSSQSLEPVIRYRFSIVLNPISVSRQVVTRPLPETSLNILYQDLEWRDFSWGASEISIRGKEFPLSSLFYVSRTHPIEVPTSPLDDAVPSDMFPVPAVGDEEGVVTMPPPESTSAGEVSTATPGPIQAQATDVCGGESSEGPQT